jgi:hypothetical protein
MRFYVAGPMTGYENLNHEAFHAEEARLRALGHVVISPARLNEVLGTRSYSDCMRLDVAIVLQVDAVSFLRGWRKSPGAQTEHAVAKAIGLDVYYPGDAVPRARRVRHAVGPTT